MNWDLIWTLFTPVMLALMVIFGSPGLRKLILTGLAAIVTVLAIIGIIIGVGAIFV